MAQAIINIQQHTHDDPSQSLSWFLKNNPDLCVGQQKKPRGR